MRNKTRAQSFMRKKKHPMPFFSEISSLNVEVETVPLPSDQVAASVDDARVPEGLVPANLLPSAGDVLAQMFAPEEHVSGNISTSATANLPLLENESRAAVVEPEFAEGSAANLSDAIATVETAEIQTQIAETPSPPEVNVPESHALGDAAPRDQLAVAEDPVPCEIAVGTPSRSEERVKPVPAGTAKLAVFLVGLKRRVRESFKGRTGSKQAHDIAPVEAAAARENLAGEAISDLVTPLENPTSDAPVASAEFQDLVNALTACGEVSSSASESKTENASEPEEPSTGGPPAYAVNSEEAETESLDQPFQPNSFTSAPESSVSSDESSTMGSQETVDIPVEQASIVESSPDSQLAESSQLLFDIAEDSYSEAEEAADTSDDDKIIAAAIERFANLAPLAPSRSETAAQDSTEFDQPKLSSNEVVDINAVLEIPRDPELANPVFGYIVPLIQIPDVEDLAPAGAAATGSGVLNTENQATDFPPSEPSGESAPPVCAPGPYRDWSFEEKLASHHEWIESKGATGKRAELAGADLEGSDLIGVNLQFVDLHDANLRAADLLMADLRDACLVRSNFRDSCLVGANLEAANLEGASLETAMGLVSRQLAGANVHQATLPPHILKFEALGEFEQASRMVHAFFVAMMSLSAASLLLIWMTKDFQLLTNSSVFFFLHSPAAAAALPTVQFYLIAPFALFILYLVFHFHLQHLWDLVLELPAVFPDGRGLGEGEPRIVMGLMRTHFRWMNADAPSTRFVEKFISVLVAYWFVPLTLLLYWMRFLTMQELRGTFLHEICVVGSVGVALYSTTKVGRSAERWTLQENVFERIFGKLKEINPVTSLLVLLGVLTFLAVGTMAGAPHNKERAPQFMAGSIRRWATSVLWSFGFDPYADLTEAAISAKPANWNGADDQVSAVKGARLNNSNFRYAQAYRVFLANAHLLHANFQGAFLSQADLRGSDLGQSNLRYAILDQAQMNHVNLDRAALDGANLSRADLRAANLSYASLADASLVDARLDGATLYGAKLSSATLIRADFEKADLREAHLEGANIEHADLQGAYLWSAKLMGTRLTNAQLATAIFVDADLRNADLRWAQLNGTVLTGADLTGANLDGADMRGAVGFGPNQICAAKSRHGLLLSDAMQAQVTAQCGAGN